MPPEIFIADSDADIESCFPVYLALRPHLVRVEFVPQIRRQQRQSFKIVALRQDGAIRSAAGFRLAEFTAWGRVLYIDDLTTLPEQRSKGFGALLLDWLIAHAREHNCNAVHLDTGYGRHDAHRLYLNKGFRLSSHHMSVELSA